MASVSRVIKLDAKTLDDEAFALIQEQTVRAFKWIGQRTFSSCENEIYLILRLYISWETIVKKSQSVGQSLVQIQYDPLQGNFKLKLYVLCQCCLLWCKRKLPYLLACNDYSLHTKKLFSIFEIIYELIELGNLLYFLKQGLYPSFLERVFNLKSNHVPYQKTRQISYNYFSRELLWNGFANILSFILPLINATHIHNFIMHLLPSQDFVKQTYKNSNLETGILCSLCKNSPILPHQFGCIHVACYYCVCSKLSSHSKLSCPLCDHVTECKTDVKLIDFNS